MSNVVGAYKSLLESFLVQSISAIEFQSIYVDRFKNEGHLDEQVFELLDELFGDVDSFTTDRYLLAHRPDFYLDEAQLRKKVQVALDRLAAFRA